MVRKLITAEQKTLNISLQIPAQDVGKKFEVVAYAVEDNQVSNQMPAPKSLQKNFTALQLKTEGFTFNRIALHER